MKICNKCGAYKPLSSFRKWKLSEDGYRKTCKTCMCAVEKVRRETSGKAKIYAKTFRDKNPASYAITRCRQTALKKGLDFDLDQHKDELVTRINFGFCEITGFPLVLTGPVSRNSKRPDAVSIDRIDTSKGYTIGNVRVVCLAVNLALNVWGEERLLPILSAWVSRTKEEIHE